MTDRPSPRIVVHPPSADDGRRVQVDATSLGVAYGVADLLEFLREPAWTPKKCG